MALPPTSHEALFMALVANSRRTGALIQENLPGEMVALIDFGQLPELRESSFVVGEGAKTQCDALFRVRLKGGQNAQNFVLLEHKSHIAPGTPSL